MTVNKSLTATHDKRGEKAFESVYFVRKLYSAILEHLWLLL